MKKSSNTIALNYFFLFFLFCCFSCANIKNAEESKSLSEEEYKIRLDKMKLTSIKSYRHAAQYKKIKDNVPVQLICYFSTSKESYCQNLASTLRTMQYSVLYDPYSKAIPWLINAKPPLTTIDEESILTWVEELSLLGYNNNCKFEGWAFDNN